MIVGQGDPADRGAIIGEKDFCSGLLSVWVLSV